jgi:hypothetical protein
MSENERYYSELIELERKYRLAKNYILKKIQCFSKEEIQEMILNDIITAEDLEEIVKRMREKVKI